MLLDIGVGIFAAILFNHVFATPLTPLFLTAGILFALSPDIDFLFVGKHAFGVKAYQHRDLLHHPLIFIPAGMILVALFNWQWALLFGLTVALHFAHDSIGLGWGVQWLYPFSKNHYSFFYIYESPKGKLPKKLFYSWRHEDMDELEKNYGDKDWIKNIYLKFHPYAIVELLVFIAALIVLTLAYWR